MKYMKMQKIMIVSLLCVLPVYAGQYRRVREITNAEREFQNSLRENVIPKDQRNPLKNLGYGKQAFGRCISEKQFKLPKLSAEALALHQERIASMNRRSKLPKLNLSRLRWSDYAEQVQYKNFR